MCGGGKEDWKDDALLREHFGAIIATVCVLWVIVAAIRCFAAGDWQTGTEVLGLTLAVAVAVFGVGFLFNIDDIRNRVLRRLDREQSDEPAFDPSLGLKQRREVVRVLQRRR